VGDTILRQIVKAIAMASVTCEAANALIEAAMKASRDIGFDAAVAVTDATGNLRAFQRADGAAFFTAEVAVSKAWTAASSGIPTHVWNDYIADPKLAPLADVQKLMAVGGGLPLFHDNKLIGGIGVSGGSHEQDRQAASTALASMGFQMART
jgi:uncharacterized protein GlcG (DUF336 family)